MKYIIVGMILLFISLAGNILYRNFDGILEDIGAFLTGAGLSLLFIVGIILMCDIFIGLP